MIKKLLVILFVSIAAYSQPEKDSLLARDHVAVIEKLRLMHYLERAMMKFYISEDYQALKSEAAFPKYYKDSIMGRNPVPSIDISQYLGYMPGNIPTQWKDFTNRVAENNLNSLFGLIHKYGYLSIERMKKYDKDNFWDSVIFLERWNKRDKEFKKLAKQEYRIGNMPEKEYEMIKFILKRLRVLTDYDIKRLEKKSGVKLITRQR